MPKQLLIVPNYATARALPGVRVDRRNGVGRYITEDGYLVLSTRSIRGGALRGYALTVVVLHLTMPALTAADWREIIPALNAGVGA
jgi:hypothetical protein